jgi:hypothetical protein
LFAIAGLGRLQETVEKVRRHLQHPGLAIVSLLLTRVSKNKTAAELERQLRTTASVWQLEESFGDEYRAQPSEGRYETARLKPCRLDACQQMSYDWADEQVATSE